jgi:hypothetical protein
MRNGSKAFPLSKKRDRHKSPEGKSNPAKQKRGTAGEVQKSKKSKETSSKKSVRHKSPKKQKWNQSKRN